MQAPHSSSPGCRQSARGYTAGLQGGTPCTARETKTVGPRVHTRNRSAWCEAQSHVPRSQSACKQGPAPCLNCPVCSLFRVGAWLPRCHALPPYLEFPALPTLSPMLPVTSPRVSAAGRLSESKNSSPVKVHWRQCQSVRTPSAASVNMRQRKTRTAGRTAGRPRFKAAGRAAHDEAASEEVRTE